MKRFCRLQIVIIIKQMPFLITIDSHIIHYGSQERKEKSDKGT